MTRAAWTAMLGGKVELPEGRARAVSAPTEPAVTLPPVQVQLRPKKPKPVRKIQLAPPKERDILAGVLKLTSRHPKVRRAWRNNTGMMSVMKRRIRFGLPGSPDVIGFLRDGRFLAIEVKAPGKRPTPEQMRFLVDVAGAGGVAGCVRTLDEAFQLLEAA